MARYTYQPFPYQPPPELDAATASGRRWPVAIVGAGPIGLAAAIDLALHGVESVVLDDNNVVSVGSRAICWSKRTLEVFDRLGVGERMVDKGVTWQLGRLFHHDQEVWNFDLLPESGHKMPAFINLQQYYVEEYLVERVQDFPEQIDLRWKNRVVGLDSSAEGVRLQVETPDGTYAVEAEYVLACDGAKSSIREMLGLEFAGKVFEERFLIADVEMQADFPSERWFWFEPPFHAGQSALLHKQPDNIYRIDLQLGWEADPEEEKRPEKVIPRIQAAVGDREFELDWVSVYTFQCRRMERFVHGRVLFVGDSAHIVSPFGARGGNGGVQDVDNLCWKLAAVLQGQAPEKLLESYNTERIHGADENLLNSSRSTNFMTPKTRTEQVFRDAVLSLAKEHAFARRLVNSGRLSLPATLEPSPLNGEADADFAGVMCPGAPMLDAPVQDSGKSAWLLESFGGTFRLLHFPGPDTPSTPEALRVAEAGFEANTILVHPPESAPSDGLGLVDTEGLVQQRYEGLPGTTYLIRPDQHVAARWRTWSPEAVRQALRQATGNLRRDP